MKAVRPVITSNGVPSRQMRLVGSHSMSGREMKGKKERTLVKDQLSMEPGVAAKKALS